MEDLIKNILKDRKEQNLLREMVSVQALPEGMIRVDGKDYINFSSNDYLSLSSELVPDAESNTFFSGTCSSRLMTGTTDSHTELEEKTARFKQKPAVLVFNTGYQANVGVISALLDKNDVIFSDRLNHASIVDGIRLAGSSFFRFRHNDINHLERLLMKHRKSYKRALIVTETVFSMDGDTSPLKEICALKDRYGSILMVDEAHATGVFGKNGSGMVEQEQVSDKVDLIMGTYSKALAGFGAYVACSDCMKEYLVNYCRSLIYSTSLPEYMIKINLASLDMIEKEPFRRIRLLENAEYLRGLLKEEGFQTYGRSQIVPVIIGDVVSALKASEKLKDRGYWVTAVRPPTVPEGQSRIRLSLTYAHKKEMLDGFVKDLKDCL